jgi:hypothetical protein
MADMETLRARLTEAEGVLHTLILGKTVTSASFEGKAVTYTPADEAKVRGYIAELRAQLGLSARRPIGVAF